MIQEVIVTNSPTKASLSNILRKVGIFFTVEEASKILNLPNKDVAKILARWRTQGWLVRIKRGLYSKLPLEVESSDKFILEDPWILIPKLYAISYIGGWTAAEYWGLTEQIFNDVCVFSSKYSKITNDQLARINFTLYPTKESRQFGLQTLWRNGIKVNVSDPSRTMIDMLNDSRVGGGIENIIDCLRNYINSEHFNTVLLIEYATKLHNGAILKRLGYLAEILLGRNHELIAICKNSLTKGKAQLDPNLKGKKLITRWKLFIPDKLQYEQIHDNT